MSTLLIRGISQLVTCDDGDRILKGVDLFCEGGFIRQIGAHLDVSADEVIDGTHMLCYPGLVNTHHHLYHCLLYTSGRSVIFETGMVC